MILPPSRGIGSTHIAKLDIVIDGRGLLSHTDTRYGLVRLGCSVFLTSATFEYHIAVYISTIKSN